MERPKYLTVPETAVLVHKTPRAVWHDIYRRKIPHIRWGRRVLIPIAELEKFLAALVQVSAEEARAKVAEGSPGAR